MPARRKRRSTKHCVHGRLKRPVGRRVCKKVSRRSAWKGRFRSSREAASWFDTHYPSRPHAARMGMEGLGRARRRRRSR